MLQYGHIYMAVSLAYTHVCGNNFGCMKPSILGAGKNKVECLQLMGLEVDNDAGVISVTDLLGGL